MDRPSFGVTVREWQKFRIAHPRCPICNESIIDRVIEDYGKVKYVMLEGAPAWITRNHRPIFTNDEIILIERQMQKRIGAPLIDWEPKHPARIIHAFCRISNTRVTPGMRQMARLAEELIKR